MPAKTTEINFVVKGTDDGATATLDKVDAKAAAMAAKAKERSDDQAFKKFVAQEKREQDQAFRDFLAAEREAQRKSAEQKKAAEKAEFEQTDAGRIKKKFLDDRREGETALEKYYRPEVFVQEKLEELLGGSASGSAVAKATLVLEGLNSGLEKVQSHLKAVREGSESAGEGLLKGARDFLEAIPVLGQAAKLGRTVAGFFIEDQDERLKKVRAELEEITKITDQLQASQRRAKLDTLTGTDRTKQEEVNRYEEERNKKIAERSKLLEEHQATDEEIALHRGINDDGHQQQANEMEASRSALRLKIGAINKLLQDDEKHHQAEEARITSEGMRSRAEIVLRATREIEKSTADARMQELRESGRGYEAEYIARILDLQHKGADAVTQFWASREKDPGGTSSFAKAMVAQLAQFGLEAKRAAESRGAGSRGLFGASAEEENRAARDRENAVESNENEIGRIESEARVRRLRRLSLDFEADTAEAKQRLKERLDQLSDEEQKASTPDRSREQLQQIGQDFAARRAAIIAAAAEDAADAKKNQHERDLAALERRESIEHRLADSRISNLNTEAELGNTAAGIEAKKLEIAEKYKQRRSEILRILRDEKETVANRALAATGLLGLGAAERNELKKATAYGGSQATDFSLDENRYLTGVRGASDPAVSTAEDTQAIRKIMEALAENGPAVIKFITSLSIFSPSK